MAPLEVSNKAVERFQLQVGIDEQEYLGPGRKQRASVAGRPLIAWRSGLLPGCDP